MLHDPKAKGPATSDPGILLQTRKLTKRFRGFTALDRIDLSVHEGEIHALIGPNGAGKTTCFNLLTKFLRPTSGTICFDDHEITHEQPAQIARRGMIRSFQISAIFPGMLVLDNIRVALQRATSLPWRFWRSEELLTRLDARALALLDQVGLASLADQRAGDLAYGHKRALELATTLAMQPRLMLLDEPTQGIGREDIDRLTQLIRQARRTCTILMVEHNMDVVAAIADRITVLAAGRILAEGTYHQIARDPAVLEAYMGTPT